MLTVGFLAVLMAVVLGAVWSAFRDLQARDRQPPTPPPPAPSQEGVWPPPPKI